MTTTFKWFTGLLVAVTLLFALLVVEASFGHDGLLCEWGYDRDGAGDQVTSCG